MKMDNIHNIPHMLDGHFSQNNSSLISPTSTVSSVTDMLEDHLIKLRLNSIKRLDEIDEITFSPFKKEKRQTRVRGVS